MNLNILFQIEVANSLFTVTDKFSELFNQFIFDGHGQKNPVSIFSSWLVENQSSLTADDLEVLSLCMSGVVKPLTPKQKIDTADEKVRLQVINFLNVTGEDDEIKTKKQAFTYVSKLLKREIESVETMYKRAVKKFERGTTYGRFEFIENVDQGFYIIRLILKG